MQPLKVLRGHFLDFLGGFGNEDFGPLGKGVHLGLPLGFQLGMGFGELLAQVGCDGFVVHLGGGGGGGLAGPHAATTRPLP